MAIIRAALFTAALAACNGPPCRVSSVFLRLAFDGASAGATNLDVVLSLDGLPEQHKPVGIGTALGGGATLEIDIPGYRAGASLSIRVDAFAARTLLGSGSTQITLDAGCSTAMLDVSAGSLADMICSLPDGGTAYADPNGADDPAHGGGPLGCAFHSLTYALGHASGEIVVGDATWGPDETFPLMLTGTQSLNCLQTLATISGSGFYSPVGGNAVIVLQGSANQLIGCTVRGDADTTACIYVETEGVGPGHVINKCTVTDCPPATGKGENVFIGDSASNVTIQKSWFRNGFNAIYWLNSNAVGVLSGNDFDPDIRTHDIYCVAASPNITGSMNAQSSGAAPTCSNCVNCSFYP
jgi:hypothetical protein